MSYVRLSSAFDAKIIINASKTRCKYASRKFVHARNVITGIKYLGENRLINTCNKKYPTISRLTDNDTIIVDDYRDTSSKTINEYASPKIRCRGDNKNPTNNMPVYIHRYSINKMGLMRAYKLRKRFIIMKSTYDAFTINNTKIKSNKRKYKENKEMNAKSVIVERLNKEKGDVLTKFVNSSITKLKDLLLKSIGYDFIFVTRDNEQIVDYITNKFLVKYDKRFKEHTQKIFNNTYRIVNKSFFVKLNDATYVYVASGIKIPNVELVSLSGNGGFNSSDLYIYIFGKYAKKYQKYINKLIDKIFNMNELGIFSVTSDPSSPSDKEGNHRETLDITFQKMNPREFSTLFFSNGEKEKVVNHINRFIDNEEFYKERQILYKTGILLYGEPGTGKSSFVKAISTKYNRCIISINVANIETIDLTLLSQAITSDEERRYIVLMEDIDTIFRSLDREDDTDLQSKKVINKLLQFLDSNTSPANAIFVATTNHLDKLDDALLREGRFDLKVEVAPINVSEVYEFGKCFGLNKETVSNIIESIRKDKGDPELSIFNQSTVQARILANIENKDLDHIRSIYGEMEDASVTKGGDIK